jgi:cytochrome c biogenesis protein
VDEQSGSRPAGSGLSRVGKITWKIFSSPLTATILILILVGLSLIGTFVVQVPPEYKSNINAYDAWLQNIAQPQTGFWYPFLNYFQLFDVFHSFGFLGAGTLLIINIIVCSLSRWKRTRISLTINRTRKSESFYNSIDNRAESIALPATPESAEMLKNILEKRRYHIEVDSISGNIYMTADKNRFSPLGTYLIHFSIILLIIGYLVGGYLGFKDTYFIVPEGLTRSITDNSGLSLQLKSFTDEYYPDGSPRDFRSEVAIIQNDREVKTGTVQVNHPLTYNGLRVYQSDFGPASRIQVRNPSDGKVLFDGNIALYRQMTDGQNIRSWGDFNLVREGYLMYFVGRTLNVDDTVLTGQQIGMDVFKTGSSNPVASTKLEKGTAFKVDDNIEITYLGDGRYSLFQVSRDPGNNIVWISCGLLLSGLLTVFYFPRRRIWALLQDIPGKERRLWLRAESGFKPGAAAELQSLAKEIRQNTNAAEHSVPAREVR